MNVIAVRFQIAITGTIHRQRLVTTAKKMAGEGLNDQIDQMIIMGHQTFGMYPPVGFPAILAQESESCRFHSHLPSTFFKKILDIR